jgi:hypothetical protein
MPIFRTSLYRTLETLAKTLVSGRPTKQWSLAQCLFSRGDLSLDCQASSWVTSRREALFMPGCPRLWPTAATGKANSCSSDREHSLATILKNLATPCITSTEWAGLWNRYGRYSLCTACAKLCSTSSSSFGGKNASPSSLNREIP